MAEPTIQEVFGGSSTEDPQFLYISKNDMANAGLTVAAQNRIESMIVAMMILAANSLTEANRLTDLVNRNVTIAYNGQDLIDQGGGNVFLRDTYAVSFYKPTSIQPIDPDNY